MTMTQIAICIDVPDLEVAVSFYCSALGCEKLSGHSANTKLSAGNMEIYLLLKEEGSKPVANTTDTRSYSRHWTPIHLDFRVTDFEQTVNDVTNFGGSHEGTDSGDWGAIAYCADPFGNGFCLIKEGK